MRKDVKKILWGKENTERCSGRGKIARKEDGGKRNSSHRFDMKWKGRRKNE